MDTQIPYSGPGADNNSDISFADQVKALVNTPAGYSPAPPGELLKTTALLGQGNDINNGVIGANANLIYSELTVAGTVANYDFNNSNCFPLADAATSTVKALPATTVLTSLLDVVADISADQGTLYPATADSSTAAPLTYVRPTGPNPVGIVFSDTNAGGVAACVNLNKAGSSAHVLPFANASSIRSFVWGIAFRTPTTLSSGDGSLFVVGDALDSNLQIAFVVKSGKIGAYINGNHFLDSGITAAVSTTYTAVVHYKPDPDNALNFLASIYVSGADVKAQKSFPYPVVETPWAAPIAPGTGLYPLASATDGVGDVYPSVGFGPLPAFGGQWAFTALGYYAEDLTNHPLRSASGVADILQRHYHVTHAV